MSALGNSLRSIANEVIERIAPETYEKIYELADKIDEAEVEHDAALSEAEDKATAAQEEAEDAAEEAELYQGRAFAAEEAVHKILEAAIAAREGLPGAAAGTVRLILDLQPDLTGEVPRLALLARTRPADYWS